MIALVTGSSSGIGRSTALKLAQDGYNIIIHYNSNKASALTLKKDIENGGRQAYLLKLDLKDTQSLQQQLKENLSDLDSHVSVLINNAGITHDMPAVLIEHHEWLDVLNVNLNAPFLLSQWFLKQLPRKELGSIVNISSIAAQIGNPGQTSYSASKAGLVALTKSLAKEVGRKSIRVNAIAAGIIETKMIEKNQHLESFKDQIPLKRYGKPSEIANVVSFLCSEKASYITGQTIGVNGGLFCP